MGLIKTKEEILIMADAGKRLADVLMRLREAVEPGITTEFLDQLAFDLIHNADAEPAFLGYKPGGAGKPYPATLCASVNDNVVHGLPSRRILEEGDLVKLDLGLVYKKFYVDSAITVGVGSISKEATKLIQVTESAMHAGIAAAKPGNALGDIGFAVQSVVEKNGFSVVRSLTGHGIGKHLHEDPPVFNYGKAKTGMKLEEGMVIAIEPMVNVGGYKVDQLKDDSFKTADGSLSAHFEHTVAIMKNGPRILTQAG